MGAAAGALAVALTFGGPLAAQVFTPEPEFDPFVGEGEEITPRAPLGDVPVIENPVTGEIAEGTGVALRGLDMMTGGISDLEIANGDTGMFGRLEIAVTGCRYPVDNPAGEAIAYLTIRETGRAGVLFEGWMFASAPALSALDHPRFDIWVLRCTGTGTGTQ